MDKKKEIIAFCNSLGLDTIGFIKCRCFDELKDHFLEREKLGLINEFEEKDMERRINPFLYMPQGKTIISIAFPYFFEEKNKEDGFFSVYTLGRDYHSVVKEYLNEVCNFINVLGGDAEAFVDSNGLPERYIAYLSGIGFIGRNNMLITEKYGSYVFLGEIITDLELEENLNSLTPINEYKSCGECRACIESCPTKAINLIRNNSNNCLSYITQKKHIEDYWFNKIQGRLFGCDSCQSSCPYNSKIKDTPISDFIPYDFMKEPDLEEIINLDNKTFKEKYSKTSCGWRGKALLQRNAFIVSSNNNKILEVKDIKSPYVKDYFDRLLALKRL